MATESPIKRAVRRFLRLPEPGETFWNRKVEPRERGGGLRRLLNLPQRDETFWDRKDDNR